MGINFAKTKSYKGKCVKRASAELVKSVVGGSQAAARDFLEEEEAQDENEDELLGMYRPKNDTYSLHDFLKENQEEQPVLVRRNKSVESFASAADLEDQYNFVLSSGSQLAESVILKPSTNPSTASELPVPMSSQFNRLKGGKPWLFEVIHLPLERFSLHTLEAWNQQSFDFLATHPELQCHKLSETRILIDLSQALVGQQSLDKPLLVLCVDQLLGKVVLNTAFKCGLHEDRVRTLFRINKATAVTNGLAHIVQLVLDICRPFYLKSLEENKSEQKNCAITCTTVRDWQFKCNPLIAAGQAFELVYPQTTEKAQEEDVLSDISDFETIDMEEFEDEVEKVPVVEVCEQCGDKQDAVVVHMLDTCGHRFCGGCLAGVVMSQLEMAKLPVKCLNSVCECEVPLEVLQLAAGKVVSECTSCHDLISVDGPGDFASCAAPNCAQANECPRNLSSNTS
uniref:RING-type domain-containing protein n=1 Tax=Ditylenchus dipsaci TaxID=166011 RepID=A0A915ES16_9BILA